MSFIKASNELIRIDLVESVLIDKIEQGEVTVIHSGGKEINAYGFDAIEIVMLLKPSALEGKRMRWQKNSWAFHNLIGHPVMQFLAWIGFKKQAIKFHDFTTPFPRDFKEQVK